MSSVRLPPKRKREPMGIEREPPRKFPHHERWVRSHACSIRGCWAVPIEYAHVRNANNAGIGIKSRIGISLCAAHHAEQHRIGVPRFQQKYGIDMMALAMSFVERSPDKDIRAAMAELERE